MNRKFDENMCTSFSAIAIAEIEKRMNIAKLLVGRFTPKLISMNTTQDVVKLEVDKFIPFFGPVM